MQLPPVPGRKLQRLQQQPPPIKVPPCSSTGPDRDELCDESDLTDSVEGARCMPFYATHPYCRLQSLPPELRSEAATQAAAPTLAFDGSREVFISTKGHKKRSCNGWSLGDDDLSDLLGKHGCRCGSGGTPRGGEHSGPAQDRRVHAVRQGESLLRSVDTLGCSLPEGVHFWTLPF